MLTNDEDIHDITAATGISFDVLLHLFLSTKIIKYTVTSVVNWYIVLLTNIRDCTECHSNGVFKNGSNDI